LGDPTEVKMERAAVRAVQLQKEGLPKWMLPGLGTLIVIGIVGAVVMYANVASLGAKMDAHIAASASPQELIDAAEARINNTLAADEARRVEDDREFREKMRELAAQIRDLERN